MHFLFRNASSQKRLIFSKNLPGMFRQFNVQIGLALITGNGLSH